MTISGLVASWRGLMRQQRIALAFGVLVLAVSVAAFVWTMLSSTPPQTKLPGYALRSTFVFQVERALALAAGFAVVGVFVARLIAGDLPSGITTSGIEWRAESEIAAGLKKAQQSVEDVTKAAETNAEAIERLRAEVDGLGSTVRGEVATTLAATQASLDDVRRATEAQTAGIRIIADELQPLVALPELLAQLRQQVQPLQGNLQELQHGLARLQDETIGQLTDRVDKLENK